MHPPIHASISLSIMNANPSKSRVDHGPLEWDSRSQNYDTLALYIASDAWTLGQHGFSGLILIEFDGYQALSGSLQIQGKV